MLFSQLCMKSPAFLTCIIGIAASLCTSCHPRQEKIYENEYGEIRLSRLNDSLVHARFSNNNDRHFEADLKTEYAMALVPHTDSMPFLAYKTGGIEQLHGSIRVHDFTNVAVLDEATGIEAIYTRPFYETGKTVTLCGDIKAEKGGASVEGIYLDGYAVTEQGYCRVTGIIHKEPWPDGTAPESENQQSIWNDHTVKQYRLVFENYTVTRPDKRHFIGYTININGEAALVTDESDVEAYYLDGAKPWTGKELNRRIELEATLVQFIDGKSILKNWAPVQ